MGKEARSGTLMWIGSRSDQELRPIFQSCQENVSQIAVRRDLHDARRRRADNVKSIIIARSDRSPVDYSALQKLLAQHPYAQAMELLSSLCTQRETATPGVPKVYWHCWNQVQDALSDCGVMKPKLPPAARSVAVIADSISKADPLMDLAVATDAAAVWCRRGGDLLARNFDVIWWDDSVATPVSETAWRERLTATRHECAAQTHVWLTNFPTPSHVNAARSAGVSTVLSKPINIESLLATIGAGGQQQISTSKHRLHAA